jgi:hypothetical protein
VDVHVGESRFAAFVLQFGGAARGVNRGRHRAGWFARVVWLCLECLELTRIRAELECCTRRAEAPVSALVEIRRAAICAIQRGDRNRGARESAQKER